jgi:hypothetical protein
VLSDVLETGGADLSLIAAGSRSVGASHGEGVGEDL